MAPHQTDELKKKIADIKRILAAEKRKFDCYDDSLGLRYLPTRYFVQLGDYTGGLAYLNWFDKTSRTTRAFRNSYLNRPSSCLEPPTKRGRERSIPHFLLKPFLDGPVFG